jgi:hypothetical protein
LGHDQVVQILEHGGAAKPFRKLPYRVTEQTYAFGRAAAKAKWNVDRRQKSFEIHSVYLL